MKKVLAVLFAVMLLVSCTGKAGPEGKTGPTGPTGPVGSYSIFFQQGVAPYAGYDGCVDTSIDSDAINNNYGNSNNLPGNYVLHPMWNLVKFDVSYLQPSNVKVDAAYIILKPISFSTTLTNAQSFKVTAAWDEGTGNMSASGDGATWISRTASAMWVNQGGDYDNTSSGGAVTITAGSNEICIPVKPSVIESWLTNPSANYGIILTYASGSFNAYSRSNGISSLYAPKLVVYYRLQ